MEQIYQNVIRKIIVDYRKKKGYSLRKMAQALCLDHSHLYRMEKGERSITLENACVIVAVLGLDIKIDTERSRAFNDLFASIFMAVINVDRVEIRSLYEELMTLEEDIYHSLDRYRYDIYKLLCRVNLDHDISHLELYSYKKYVYFLEDSEKRILYDAIGLYLQNHFQIDEAYSYFRRSMSFGGDDLAYALSASHAVQYLVLHRHFFEAYTILKKAMDIFEKNAAKRKMRSCLQILGNLYSYAGDHKRAYDSYIQILDKYDIYGHERYLIIDNIIWSLIKINDDKKLEKMIDLLKNDNGIPPKTSFIVSYYLFTIDDVIRFDHWHKLFKEKSEGGLYDMIIDLLDLTIKKESITKIIEAYQIVMPHIVTPKDNDELVIIEELMAKVYEEAGDMTKAAKTYKKLYNLKSSI